MQQVKKMGPLQNVLGMMPGMPKEVKNAEIDDKEIGQVEAIIRSMTPEERRKPELINGSRRGRIAKGSGTTTAEVNNLLKQFKQVQQMMKSDAGRAADDAEEGQEGQEGQEQRPQDARGMPPASGGFRLPGLTSWPSRVDP